MKNTVRALCRPTAAAAMACLLQLTGAPAQAQLVQWTVESGGNGHWYQYIAAPSIFAPVSFAAARADALARSHLGLDGYLATVTSAEEQAFINGAFSWLTGFGASGSAWLGASDAEVEGQWRWLDGPEAGQLLGYTYWGGGQPATGPGFEAYDYLAQSILVSSTPAIYFWAAQPGTGAFGYVVEYGLGTTPPIPEPAGAATLAAGLAALAWVARRRRTAADRGR